MVLTLLENISVILISLLCFILGIIVYLKNPKSASHRLFILFCADTVLWTITNYISLHYLNLFWMRLVMFFAVPQAFLFFLFVHTFPKEKIQLSKKIILILVAFILLVMVLTLSPALFTRLEYKDGQPSPVPGPAMLLFVISSFGSYFAGIFYAIKKLRYVETKIEKIQWQSISFGLIGTFLLVISFNFLAVMIFNESRFVKFGPIFFLPFIFGASIAITRYHLFGIRVILTETLVAVIGLTLLTQALTASNLGIRIFDFFILVIFSAMGYLLIKYTHLEIQRRQEIEKIDKAKSEFISIASHQLRTPLTAVKGYISMILEGTYGQLAEKQTRPLENVYQSNERLIRLVNDLLNLSRLDAGKIEFSPTLASLEEMVSSIVEELRINAEKKGLYMKMIKPSESLPKIMADQDKLRQVILNIVDNAIKYTKEGGITLELKKLDEREEVRVSDTGEGIDKEELNSLFQMFSRATAGTQLHAEGTGLGLYVARQFIEMHGGKIWAESKGKGKGSAFIIQLPIKLDPKLLKEKTKTITKAADNIF